MRQRPARQRPARQRPVRQLPARQWPVRQRLARQRPATRLRAEPAMRPPVAQRPRNRPLQPACRRPEFLHRRPACGSCPHRHRQRRRPVTELPRPRRPHRPALAARTAVHQAVTWSPQRLAGRACASRAPRQAPVPPACRQPRRRPSHHRRPRGAVALSLPRVSLRRHQLLRPLVPPERRQLFGRA